MNIIIVEDSQFIRQQLIRLLQKLPEVCVVGEAAEETAAWVLIGELEPDLVLLDISLSSGNGLSLLKRLRGKGFTGQIVMVTNQDTPYRQVSLELGADAFFDKSMEIEGLLSWVGSHGFGAMKQAIQG